MKLFQSGPTEMPFLDHLEELRWRLLWSLLAVVIASVVGYFLVTRLGVLAWMIAPIVPFLEDGKLKFLDPTEPFFLTLRLSIIVGLILASPVVIYQIWSFVSPALLPSEKRAIVPSLYLGLVLFAAGVAMAYYLVLPMTLKFTMSFQTESLEPAITVDRYMKVATQLLLAFGIVFEMPVVILILSVLGLVTPQFLAEKRRYAIAIITIASALLTPGDVITVTVMMMVPLMLLYELSIVLARVVYRRRAAVPAPAEG